MLSRERLKEHLLLQNELNLIVNPDWLSAGNNWTRAIMVESVELLDHYGWKWWKHQEPNLAQIHLELVDIWHFILSHELDNHGGHVGDAIDSIIHDIDSERNPIVPLGYHMVDHRLLNTRQLIDLFIASSAAGFVHLSSFNQLMHDFNLSWEKLDLLYRTKNVLNVFRQKHGYKDGSYVKTWLGQEDNEVLYGLLEQRPDATVEQLNSKLETIYTQVTQGVPA